jgi:outer membrane biosynthesis protein TonB
VKNEFGAYELRKQIGKGGMAWVYLAVQKALDRPVAIKILFPHLAEDESLVARFQLEARAAARMKHENIVQVIDYGKFEDQPYIAMEYIEGLNLREWHDKHGTPPIEVALVMLRDLSRGLEHAHGREIVHRDIKPSNIMFTPDGTIKLMDFGLARRVEDHTVMTVAGAVLGTVPYMSPEQSNGQRVEQPSDIFSLGVVFYELLGGERPFVGETQSAITAAILHGEPRPLTNLNPLVPESMTATIKHMLEKDAHQRCQSISEVRQALDRILVEMGIFQDRVLLADYAQAPDRVSEDLRRKRLATCLERGAALELDGPQAIDRALREYEGALHLDPGSKVAKDGLRRLKQAQAQISAAAPPPASMEDSGSDRTMVMPPGGVPHAPAAPPPVAPKPEAPKPEAQKPASGGLAAMHQQRPVKPAPPAPDAVKPVAPPPPRPAPAQRPAPAPKPAPAPTPRPAPRPAKAAAPANTRTLIFVAAGLIAVIVIVAIVMLISGGKKRGPQTGAESAQAPIVAPMPAAPESTIASAQAGEPTGATLKIVTDPPAASVSLDGGASQPSPAMFVGTDAGPHKVKVELPGFLTAERRVAIAAGRDTSLRIRLKTDQTQTAAGAAQKPHYIVVETEPAGASVGLDERPMQPSPARFAGVGEGRHVLRVTMAGFAPHEAPFVFSGRQDSTLKIALAPSATAAPAGGFLSLKAVPSGDFYVDGVLRVTNRDTAFLAVSPGTHKIQIRRANFRAFQNDVRVMPGMVKALWAVFEENIGYLRITTADGLPGVVILGGDTRLPAPAPNVYPLKPGTYYVRLAREGYTTVENVVQKKISAHDTTTINFTWKKL